MIGAILLDIILLIIYPSITYAISYVGKLIFSNAYTQYNIINRPFILGDVFLLDIFGKYPSQVFSIYSALVSLLVLMVVPLFRFFTKPIVLWVVIISFINFISSMFFIFFANHFPYSMLDYIDLYMKTLVSIWLLIPWVLLTAFLPLPAKFWNKLIFILLADLYGIIFGCIRYIVYIFIFREFSYIFMAPVFFMLGPFFDFVFVVAFYSVFVSNLALKLKKDDSKWGWLY